MNNFTIVRNPKSGTIAWSEDQMKYIISEYKKGKTLSALGREFGVSYSTIRNLLKRKGIKTEGNKHNFPRDEFYFSNIDSKEKAYWLGFLYADGCVHSTSNEISITLKDRDHLEKFRKAIKSNNKIGESIDRRFSSLPKIYHFSIKDKQLKSDLIKWGCVPNKSLSLTKIPNIPRDFVSHFIRGYFDGDGSLHWLNGTKNFRISFVGTAPFLKDIQKELGLSLSLGQQKGNQSKYFQVAGRKQVPMILDYIYKDSDENIRLTRKYKNYLDCLTWAHRH